MKDIPAPGASPGEWAHWTLVLGLGSDLLPVVSRTDAIISPRSTLKAIGKVPSRYDGARQVVGIARWTTLRANDALLDQWQQEGDYGICLQTRAVRAIDVDLERAADVGTVCRIVAEHLGGCPTRRRANSSRVAIAFTLEGPGLGKRAIRGANGAIEFLGDGNQFIVAGTHPSGARYYWDGLRGGALPSVTREQFERCWAELERHFGAAARPGPERINGHGHGNGPGHGGLNGHGHPALAGVAIDVPGFVAPGAGGRAAGGGAGGGADRDPVVAWLEHRGWVLGTDRDRRRTWITCPWDLEHSTDTGASATCWLAAGTNGYERGHFECLHAHCADRNDEQFLEAVGYEQATADDFAVVDAAAGGDPGAVDAARHVAGRGCEAWYSNEPGQGLKRSKRGWLATIDNVCRALRTAGWWVALGFDAFRAEIMYRDWANVAQGPAAGWRVWTDDDLTRARVALEKAGFEPVGRDLARDAVALVAAECVFDSAQCWLAGLPPWDGVPRVARWLADVCSAADTPYTAAVSTYLWTALAARVLNPGCQADMVPILVGGQGVGKTRTVRAIAPAVEYYASLSFESRDADLGRRLRGKLVAEVEELRGLHTRAAEAIKAFVSATADQWVPKYKEYAVTFPRRFVMVGTTNADAFLADETGERRWLPVRVGRCDVERVAAGREQCWAEAACLSRGVFGGAGGAAAPVWQAAQDLAGAEHAAFKLEDAWTAPVATWLRGGDDLGGAALGAMQQKNRFSALDCLVGALGFDPKQVSRTHEMRVATVLRCLGGNRRDARGEDGRVRKLWFFDG